jgi:hypothetical protein
MPPIASQIYTISEKPVAGYFLYLIIYRLYPCISTMPPTLLRLRRLRYIYVYIYRRCREDSNARSACNEGVPTRNTASCPGGVAVHGWLGVRCIKSNKFIVSIIYIHVCIYIYKYHIYIWMYISKVTNYYYYIFLYMHTHTHMCVYLWYKVRGWGWGPVFCVKGLWSYQHWGRKGFFLGFFLYDGLVAYPHVQACVSVSVCVSVFVCLCVCLYVCLCVCVSLPLSVCVWLRLSLSLYIHT